MENDTPRSVIQTPLIGDFHLGLFDEFFGDLGQFRTSGRRILDVVERLRETSKIVDGGRVGHPGDEGAPGLPMGRDAEDGLRLADLLTHRTKTAGELIVLDGIHGTAMTQKQNWQGICAFQFGGQPG